MKGAKILYGSVTYETTPINHYRKRKRTECIYGQRRKYFLKSGGGRVQLRGRDYLWLYLSWILKRMWFHLYSVPALGEVHIHGERVVDGGYGDIKVQYVHSKVCARKVHNRKGPTMRKVYSPEYMHIGRYTDRDVPIQRKVHTH